MAKCVFNVDGKHKQYENQLQVLNEAGYLLPGQNFVLGSCDLANMIGTDVRSSDAFYRGSEIIEVIPDPLALTTDEFFSRYRTLTQIYERLNNICGKSSVCMSEVLTPTTIKGNVLMMYKIGNGSNKILITGGIHSREWLSIATVSYIVNKLTDLYTNGEWKDIFAENTFYIIPISNPDGYELTQTTNNRFNRKNLNGVDLNRNWDVGFESNSNKASETYGGTHPFTENETRAIKNVIDSNDFVIHLDIHSYSQIIAAAWSYTEEKHPRHDEFQKVGKIIKDSMTHNNYITGHGSVNNTLGLAGGTLQDYTSNNGSLGFTIELPPKTGGISSFSVNSSNIIPVGNDLLTALKNISSDNKYNTAMSVSQVKKENTNTPIYMMVGIGIFILILVLVLFYFFNNVL